MINDVQSSPREAGPMEDDLQKRIYAEYPSIFYSI